LHQLLETLYNKEVKRIQSLPVSLRPREKLLKGGPEALSMEELLAVIMVTGTRTSSVHIAAQKIAKLVRKQEGVNREKLKQLGIGPSKIAQILAALELGKRFGKERTHSFTSADQVFAFSYEITQSKKESLLCFYLNARGDLVKKEILAVGALNRVNITPTEIFSLIKDQPISSIILVHNHPSGNLEPSDDDILFTKRIKAAGDILGVKLLDHLIISQDGWNRIQF
jgi:DNA repair protein RadC